jgi:hypothetical protein
MIKTNPQTSGFALLMTLIVVGAVISIGLSLLELTIKQLRLSTSEKDSESAFHAANAGAECLRYWRLASSTDFEMGNTSGSSSTVPMNCFGVGVQRPDFTDRGGGSEDIYQYDVQFSWTSGGANRCSKIRFITLSSDPSALSDVVLNSVQTYIPSYPNSTKSCPPGGRCTIVSVQGYNQSCTIVSAGSIGTVQREVLLEL